MPLSHREKVIAAINDTHVENFFVMVDAILLPYRSYLK
jgi:hypothetical protein